MVLQACIGRWIVYSFGIPLISDYALLTAGNVVELIKEVVEGQI